MRVIRSKGRVVSKDGVQWVYWMN